MSEVAKLTLEKKTVDTVDPRARKVFAATRQKIGFVPNLWAVMGNSPGLLQTYLMGYDLLRSESGFDPVEQEVVFMTASFLNGCTYCMAGHSMVAEKESKAPPSVLKALRSGARLPDVKLEALAEFTRIMFHTRGRPNPQQLQSFLDAGYEQHHALEVVFGIAVKTMSNYINHLFHTEIDKAFEPYRWEEPVPAE